MARRSEATARLPECCLAHALGFLSAPVVVGAGACSRSWSKTTRLPELWLQLCATRWPATASSEALRRVVRARGPLAYYARHAAVDRACDETLPPLLDIDDLLVQIQVSLGGRVLCSEAREARDVLQAKVMCEGALDGPDGVTPYDVAGVVFDDLRLRVDCSDSNYFPPTYPDKHETPLSIGYAVIRKSDGMVAVLKPIEPLGNFGGDCFGPEYNTGRLFDAQPRLSGVLPICFPVETHQLDGAYEDDRVVAFISMGKPDEFPDRELWENARRSAWPKPSLVVTSDFVEVRRVLLRFEVEGQYTEEVSLPMLHNLLTQQLRFR